MTQSITLSESENMTVPTEIVEKFVNAAVLNQPEADSLLEQYPELKSAQWAGESPLRFLAIENYAEAVRYLCKRGWPLDERDEYGTTPLIDAVRASAADSVIALLELGADPNAVSQIDDNALHCAISAGNIKMIRILLQHGANPAYTTDLGETVFDVIPNKSDKNIAIRTLLLEHGLKAPDAEQHD
ncbi:MAG: ankyrin repeat domain-containing protein [Pirellulales bacterium]|nr:ankyrin repeat domain-containing protein [Pirellulales bacterium]